MGTALSRLWFLFVLSQEIMPNQDMKGKNVYDKLNYYCYPLKEVDCCFIFLVHFQCLCGFWGRRHNLCIQLPAFRHEPLFILSGLYQRLDELLVLHPDLVHTFIPDQLIEDHLELLQGLRGVLYYYSYVLERQTTVLNLCYYRLLWWQIETLIKIKSLYVTAMQCLSYNRV